jgi:hypothetical protein
MDEWINKHPEGFVLLLIAYVVALWFLIAYIIATVGGWRWLALRFRLQGDFNGPRWSWQSAKMRGLSNYNNCLIVGADGAGLYVATLLIFRFAHPALYIPWAEITVQPYEGLLRRFLGGLSELRLGRTEQIPFRINPTLVGRLREVAGTSWPGAR